MSYAANAYLAGREARRQEGRVKSKVVAAPEAECSRKDCHGHIEWTIYRWDVTRSGRAVRRGVRSVCNFHASSIPEDTR